MTSQELHSKLQVTKSFLNREIVRNKTNQTSVLSFREIGNKLDMIHEAERVGIRNLGEYQSRKLSRMIAQVEQLKDVNMN
ncbi:MAG: hypothetical protein AAFN10_05110 [Bacteroidota bacterium]